jgi:cell cycle sensor histidine kinase DivJ
MLGLALVRGMVEIMVGTVGVRSGPGEGTIFTVRLPVASPA